MIGELKLIALKSRLVPVWVQAELVQVNEGVLICSTSGNSSEGLSMDLSLCRAT
jgi:hypothetical protein